MTYEQTLEWMFGQLPMYQQKGKSAYNAKLDNIQALSSYLDNPHEKFKSIHVGGTNGKGSSSHMLASILQEAGYKVGLYTSPHLKDFRERIRINGQMASKSFVIDFIAAHKTFLIDNRLSFFEMTVGMAFDYFAAKKVDIAIIEVGLGGRLDSTNIITPEVSLITNIGLDHMDVLGDDLVKITKEKAGIIKWGIPVVISEYHEETAPIFRDVAQKNSSEIIFAEEMVRGNYKTTLQGNYQQKNIRGVVATLRKLKDFNIEETHVVNGLMKVEENTGIAGRWQVIAGSPRVICDTAHNKEGLSLVLKQLLTEEFEALHIVLGFVQDKDLEVILPLFPKSAHYYLARPDIRRGLDVDLLAIKARAHGLNYHVCKSIPEALARARSVATQEDLIFVGGSTFTVAEVL
ncbi:MAG: folylpolyglutamate synthase/dihydrofolate synthase family protein [Flavobacteriaceae bacterium]